MFRAKNLLVPIQFLVLGLLCLLGAASCADEARNLTPPIEIPFSLDKGGEHLEFEMNIKEKQTYAFGLTFKVKKDEPGDMSRLMRLVGDQGQYPDGRYVDLGVPLKVKLQVSSDKKNINPFEFNKVETEIAVYSWGADNRNKKITNLLLEPGIYKVQVENMLAAPDFAGRSINFHIYRAYLGK